MSNFSVSVAPVADQLAASKTVLICLSLVVPGSLVLGWGLRNGIGNKFPGDAFRYCSWTSCLTFRNYHLIISEASWEEVFVLVYALFYHQSLVHRWNEQNMKKRKLVAKPCLIHSINTYGTLEIFIQPIKDNVC